MARFRPVLMFLVYALLPVTSGQTAPLPFDRDLNIPPIIEDSGAPVQCTVAFLITDISTNDTFLMRMRIAPTEEARPTRNRLPCPAAIPPRMAVRALDVCTVRTEDPNNCVYTDMARGFDRDPVQRNTASNGSRCRSDQSDFIALACWNANGLDVCGVACGQTEADARTQARARCEEKHQQSCAIIGSAPVLVP